MSTYYATIQLCFFRFSCFLYISSVFFSDKVYTICVYYSCVLNKVHGFVFIFLYFGVSWHVFALMDSSAVLLLIARSCISETLSRMPFQDFPQKTIRVLVDTGATFVEIYRGSSENLKMKGNFEVMSNLLCLCEIR